MILAVFQRANQEVASLASSISGIVDTSKPFKFADYPMTEKRLELLLKKLRDDLNATIMKGIDASWELANDKNNALVRSVLGSKLEQITEERFKAYFNNNGDALEAFKARKDGGLGLSDRVWRYTDQYKGEIEMALDIGIGEGKSAAQMTKALKQYLVNPDALYRRVRNKHGQLVASKAMAAYHPGRGVYRSAYKNARRLSATENNIAYRTADYLRWQQLDFVVGIRIQPSATNHPVADICDELAGLYPKDFKFPGWHPLCRCYATTVLKTEDELIRDVNADKDNGSVNYVADVPDRFRAWLKDNRARIKKAAKLPYFLRDNGSRDAKGIYHLKELGKASKALVRNTPLDIAKQRHEARTTTKVAEILDAWTLRKDTIKGANKMLLSDIAQTLDAKVENERLVEAINHGRWATARESMKALESLKNDILALNHMDDPLKLAQTFTLTELKGAESAIERTFNRWIWNYEDRTSLEFLRSKLVHEISVVEGKKDVFSTWQISRDAFQKRLAYVDFRLERKVLEEGMADALAFVKKSKAAENVKLLKAWDDALATEKITDSQKAADEIRAAYAKHKAAAAAKATKAGGALNVQHDLEEFCAKYGLNASQFKITDGAVDVKGDLYDAMSRNHIVSSVERNASTQYVRTSNSFRLNGMLDDIGGGGVNHSTKTFINTKGTDKYGSAMTPHDVNAIKGMDAIIDSREIPFDLNVIRMVDTGGLIGTFRLPISMPKFTTQGWDDFFAELQSAVGTEATQHRFTSTSTDKSKNVFGSRNVCMKFKLKKGQHAYVAYNPQESEIVLPRETKFKLVDVKRNSLSNFTIEVEIV